MHELSTPRLPQVQILLLWGEVLTNLHSGNVLGLNISRFGRFSANSVGLVGASEDTPAVLTDW